LWLHGECGSSFLLGTASDASTAHNRLPIAGGRSRLTFGVIVGMVDEIPGEEVVAQRAELRRHSPPCSKEPPTASHFNPAWRMYLSPMGAHWRERAGAVGNVTHLASQGSIAGPSKPLWVMVVGQLRWSPRHAVAMTAAVVVVARNASTYRNASTSRWRRRCGCRKLHMGHQRRQTGDGGWCSMAGNSLRSSGGLPSVIQERSRYRLLR